MKLALGTVQFGMAYGVANAIGQVPEKEVVHILEMARSAGIDTLDTAIAYGESEATLGRIGIDGWRVVSKLPALPEDCVDISRWVKEQTLGSLGRLGIKRLGGLLLHRPGQLLEQKKGPALLAALEEVKAQGLVEKIGVSVYSPDKVGPLFDLKVFDLVQAPLNILDRRLVSTGWASRLKAAGVELHTRSAFLQGLLLMPARNRPEKFKRWDAIWQIWSRWLSDTGLSALAACLLYPLSLEEVDKVIIGVDSATQLKQVLAASTGSLDSLPAFPEVIEPELINPALWDRI